MNEFYFNFDEPYLVLTNELIEQRIKDLKPKLEKFEVELRKVAHEFKEGSKKEVYFYAQYVQLSHDLQIPDFLESDLIAWYNQLKENPSAPLAISDLLAKYKQNLVKRMEKAQIKEKKKFEILSSFKYNYREGEEEEIKFRDFLYIKNQNQTTMIICIRKESDNQIHFYGITDEETDFHYLTKIDISESNGKENEHDFTDSDAQQRLKQSEPEEDIDLLWTEILKAKDRFELGEDITSIRKDFIVQDEKYKEKQQDKYLKAKIRREEKKKEKKKSEKSEKKEEIRIEDIKMKKYTNPNDLGSLYAIFDYFNKLMNLNDELKAIAVLHNREESLYNILFLSKKNNIYQFNKWNNDNNIETSYDDGNLLYQNNILNEDYLLKNILGLYEIIEFDEELEDFGGISLSKIPIHDHSFYTLEYTIDDKEAQALWNTLSNEERKSYLAYLAATHEDAKTLIFRVIEKYGFKENLDVYSEFDALIRNTLKEWIENNTKFKAKIRKKSEKTKKKEIKEKKMKKIEPIEIVNLVISEKWEVIDKEFLNYRIQILNKAIEKHQREYIDVIYSIDESYSFYLYLFTQDFVYVSRVKNEWYEHDILEYKGMKDESIASNIVWIILKDIALDDKRFTKLIFDEISWNDAFVDIASYFSDAKNLDKLFDEFHPKEEKKKAIKEKKIKETKEIRKMDFEVLEFFEVTDSNNKTIQIKSGDVLLNTDQPAIIISVIKREGEINIYAITDEDSQFYYLMRFYPTDFSDRAVKMNKNGSVLNIKDMQSYCSNEGENLEVLLTQVEIAKEKLEKGIEYDQVFDAFIVQDRKYKEKKQAKYLKAKMKREEKKKQKTSEKTEQASNLPSYNPYFEDNLEIELEKDFKEGEDRIEFTKGEVNKIHKLERVKIFERIGDLRLDKEGIDPEEIYYEYIPMLTKLSYPQIRKTLHATCKNIKVLLDKAPAIIKPNCEIRIQIHINDIKNISEKQSILNWINKILPEPKDAIEKEFYEYLERLTNLGYGEADYDEIMKIDRFCDPSLSVYQKAQITRADWTYNQDDGNAFEGGHDKEYEQIVETLFDYCMDQIKTTKQDWFYLRYMEFLYQLLRDYNLFEAYIPFGDLDNKIKRQVMTKYLKNLDSIFFNFSLILPVDNYLDKLKEDLSARKYLGTIKDAINWLTDKDQDKYLNGSMEINEFERFGNGYKFSNIKPDFYILKSDLELLFDVILIKISSLGDRGYLTYMCPRYEIPPFLTWDKTDSMQDFRETSPILQIIRDELFFAYLEDKQITKILPSPIYQLRDMFHDIKFEVVGTKTSLLEYLHESNDLTQQILNSFIQSNPLIEERGNNLNIVLMHNYYEGIEKNLLFNEEGQYVIHPFFFERLANKYPSIQIISIYDDRKPMDALFLFLDKTQYFYKKPLDFTISNPRSNIDAIEIEDNTHICFFFYNFGKSQINLEREYSYIIEDKPYAISYGDLVRTGQSNHYMFILCIRTEFETPKQSEIYVYGFTDDFPRKIVQINVNTLKEKLYIEFTKTEQSIKQIVKDYFGHEYPQIDLSKDEYWYRIMEIKSELDNKKDYKFINPNI